MSPGQCYRAAAAAMYLLWWSIWMVMHACLLTVLGICLSIVIPANSVAVSCGADLLVTSRCDKDNSVMAWNCVIELITAGCWVDAGSQRHLLGGPCWSCDAILTSNKTLSPSPFPSQLPICSSWPGCATHHRERSACTNQCQQSRRLWWWPPLMLIVTAVMINMGRVCWKLEHWCALFFNKKAVLSQRWPRDAPNIWVPWKFLNVHRKFEMCSLSRSCDNSEWSFGWGLWTLIEGKRRSQGVTDGTIWKSIGDFL